MSFLKNYHIHRGKNKNDSYNEERANPADMQSTAPVSSNEDSHVPSGAIANWAQHHSNDASSTDFTSTSSRQDFVLPYNESPFEFYDPLRDIKCDIMSNWLHAKQEEKLWTTGELGEGVILKVAKGNYVCCPSELRHDESSFYKAITRLNVRVAMTVNTRVIKLLLERNDLPYVQINAGLRLQVLPDMDALPYCQKHQSAAFIVAEQLLVVWEDDPHRLLERAQYLEDTLMKMIWGHSSTYLGGNDKKEVAVEALEYETLENGPDGLVEKPRRIVMMQPIMTATTLILCISAIGAGWREITIEMMLQISWIRLAFVACILPQMWLALFFFQAIVGNLVQIFGPISQMKENTKFYSGKPPRRLRRDLRGSLPHVTIQMPVYKEGLKTVIEPTIRSVKSAISTYELQGGTANIFVNDDGMQLLSEEKSKERQDFYDEHNIGWVARPPHNPNPKENGEIAFTRRGKFKKASNMNYALWTSVQCEELLDGIERHDNWTQKEENHVYGELLTQILDERNGETWADGNIRVGDYILLIDSDTRVPQDCLLEAVSEMEQSPQVAIIQYASGVMNITNSFFEKGITFFTNLVYTQIQYAVANGDVAPFIGHNAVLRWSAIQEIAYDCKFDSHEKYWSEETVSEDFDMALRLQTHGYHVRYASYKHVEFKEGVSLTVYDELARWEKYAYGCNELLFHPLKYWLVRGPFTPLFLRFITSNMPFPSKVTILAYIGTYYALGSAWLLTLANYFLIGWYNGHLDHYYLDSFKVYFAIVIVFTALGNISLAMLRYRSHQKPFWSSLIENITWIPLLLVFLGGISFHVSQALACHMIGVQMSWGATAKEVENVTFFKEIPRVIKRFKFTFAYCILLSAMMVYLALFAPPMWRITFFTPIWPLACVVVSHFSLPIVLNPNLMLFTW